MTSDIKMDQNIVLKADETAFEDDVSDSYLKVSSTGDGARIEGFGQITGKSAGSLELNFLTNGGSYLGLTNASSSPSHTVRISGSNSSLSCHQGNRSSFSNSSSVRLIDNDQIIVDLKNSSSNGVLKLYRDGDLNVSVQSSVDGGSAVFYDKDGNASIILDGRNGTIYTRGDVKKGVSQTDLNNLASTLV